MSRHRSLALCGSVMALFAAAAPAAAHVVLAEPEAIAGSSYVAAFRVSHACGDSPTIRLRVEIPAGIDGVSPQPKPGWKLTVERSPSAASGDTAAVSRISAITWEGLLDADYFDEFTALLKLPDTAGRIYFSTIQTCASGEDRQWVQIPAPGKSWNSVRRPAPVLNIVARIPVATPSAVPAAPATPVDHANHANH